MKIFAILSATALLLLGTARASSLPATEIQAASVFETGTFFSKRAGEETLKLNCVADGQPIVCDLARKNSVMTGACASARTRNPIKSQPVDVALTCANMAPVFELGLVKELARQAGVKMVCQCTDSAGGSATIRSSASRLIMSAGLLSLAPLALFFILM